ncbi:MAG: transcriptional regulator [Balneolaceae bacterium]|jgi:predicted ArsR family transcriptional regulator
MKNNLPEHERALLILKTDGPQSVKALAGEMGVTVEGARFHLLKLEKEGLVASESVAEGRGRPKQIWSLTRKGHNRFPNAHADLTVNLIEMMRETLGQNAVDDVIKANEERILSRYSEEMKELEDLEKRIEKLASIRSREGYMADYKKDEEGYLFVENHCPICSAAETCQGFCKAELEVFQQVLGKEASVERVEHIVKGARRCAYRITPTN